MVDKTKDKYTTCLPYYLKVQTIQFGPVCPGKTNKPELVPSFKP